MVKELFFKINVIKNSLKIKRKNIFDFSIRRAMQLQEVKQI